MAPASPRSGRRTVAILIALGLLAAGLCWVAASPPLSPQRDEMVLDGVPVIVEYAASASTDDLRLPLYPDAEVEESFAYTVTSKAGKPVAYYASAVLTSPDPPEKIAAHYAGQLPGRPEAEVVGDGAGTRHVLAVGDENEVRRVTITRGEDGSRIELIRATQPVSPPKPIKPRGRQEKAV